MSSVNNLKNKTILISGSSGLMGTFLTKELSKFDCNLIITDLFLNREIVDNEKLIQIKCDIASIDSVKLLLAKSVEKFKKIDCLINCAAINDSLEKNIKKNSNIIPETSEEFMKIISINLGGAYNLCTLIGEHMIGNGKGRIINIASTYGVVVPDQNIYKNKNSKQIFIKGPAYPVSKAAVIQMSKYFAALWAKKGVTINCLSPGGVLNNQDSDFIENYSKKCPMGRMANLSDYLTPILFMLSENNNYMTGSNIVIDGGWTIV